MSPLESVGPYRVVDKLGEGGMGAVYRARDTKLNRDVALKVLPEAFANDPDRLSRFEREAQLLAALNHPNIAQIYGVEDAGGVRALVMELVPGRTLEELIQAGPLPLAEASAIARQLADALEAAHDAGIIHRDLKPANIKVTDDGRVKVLDFGLAKALQMTSGSGPSAIAETAMVTSPAVTALGVILGTAAYMAPEQARGRATDRRADVWAFGAILYEMLTGRRPFKGDNISETIASLLRDEPDWTALPADTPVSVRRLLARCLEKDPAKRLRAIGDAKLDLDDRELSSPAASTIGAASVTAPPVAGRSGRPMKTFEQRIATIAVIGGLLIGWRALGNGWTTSSRNAAPAPAELRRLSVTLPSTLHLADAPAEVSLSPDGQLLVFSASEGTTTPTIAIWIRAMNSLTPRKVPGTDGGTLPFWSPDGREVAFFAGGQLKRTLSDGTGTPVTICPARDGRGGTWGKSGVIVFAPTNGGALMRVDAAGGDPVAVTTLDASRQESGERFPQFLPDGRHFLFVELPAQSGQYQISVASIDNPTRTRLRTAEGAAVFVAPGYLLLPVRNQIAAQRFNPTTLALEGDAIQLGDLSGNLGGYAGSRALTASDTGVLAFPQSEFMLSELHWFDRTGRDLGRVPAPAASYSGLTISPDGKHAAALAEAAPGQHDLWILDLERGGATRLSSDQGVIADPIWFPDSSRVLYMSDRKGPSNFYMRSASGSGAEEVVYESADAFKEPRSISADGKYLAFEQLNPQTHRDIYVLPLDGSQKPVVYRRTPFNEQNPQISPDGHWLAYVSDETGRYEAYVESFPTPGTRFAVTSTGANEMHWRSDGKRVYITSLDNRTVYDADVLTGPDMRLGPLHLVFTATANMRGGDIASDFQRALVAVTPDNPAPRALTVVLGWTGALRR
jgi:Tol biopolymer transport system component